MNEDELRQAIEAQLAAHTVMTLGTSAEHVPHAVSLMYAYQGLALFWVSARDTRHSQHLEAGGRVAVAIAGQHADFTRIRGLQMSGAAGLVASGAPTNRALDVLEARFPFFAQFRSGPQGLTAHLRAASVYRFDPARVTLIDNTRGFGFKQTLKLDD